ncbi:MAG TPA: hypothetical protein VFV94_04615 [Polyangiaceae bacterium]|nr:hypothetical protein [Polyangiaceae bacterium]
MNRFDGVRLLGAPSEERETTERTEETERLAALFAQVLPQALSNRLGLVDEPRRSSEASESSESWQGGVGELTQPAGLAPMCAETGGTEPSSDTLTFSVRAGDLGVLKCQVNRGEDGVRVVIGVDGRSALTGALAERGALEAALRATGLTVQSVAVVPLAKFGTTLARGGEAPDERHVRHVHAGPRGSTRMARRVKLIG